MTLVSGGRMYSQSKVDALVAAAKDIRQQEIIAALRIMIEMKQGAALSAVVEDFPELYQIISTAKRDGALDMREKAVGDCHRHWLFLKHEIYNDGNYEHLNSRMVEAEYLEGKLRALAAPQAQKAEEGE